MADQLPVFSGQDESLHRLRTEGAMPIINVQMLNGRTAEQKRLLIRELGKAAQRVLGVPDEALRIVLSEIDPEHWGVCCSRLSKKRAG